MQEADSTNRPTTSPSTASQSAPSRAAARRSAAPRRDSVLVQSIVLAIMVAIPLIISFLGTRPPSPTPTAGTNRPTKHRGPRRTGCSGRCGSSSISGWRRRVAHLAGTPPGPRDHALVLYFVQLAVNGTWTPLFFAAYPSWGNAALWAALGVIVTLIILVILTARAFWPVNRAAAVILLPYLAWILYASTLNAYIAVAN